MNQFILAKWNGELEINATMTDLATARSLLINKHNVYSTTDMFPKLINSMFDFDKSNQTHESKYEIWKKSMQIRFINELIF